MNEKFERVMEDNENEPFVLNSQLLQDYPEMGSISGLSKKEAPRDTWVVSQVYVNGNTIDSYTRDVEDGNPTGNIEYHLKMVEDGLNELDALHKPEYGDFIKKEREKLESRKAKAIEAIGSKKRDTNTGGGRYL